MTDLAWQLADQQEGTLSRAPRASQAADTTRAARKIRNIGLSSQENLSLLTIKHLIVEGFEGGKHVDFVRQCFKLSDLRTYSVKYNIYPNSLDRADIVFVSGNITYPMISFMNINDRLFRSAPKIALGEDFGPSDRAVLLNAGFDDAFNLGTYAPEDAASKVLSIRDRYQKTLQEYRRSKDQDRNLTDFCNPDNLSMAQKKLLTSLIEAPGRFCSYRKLGIVVSRCGDSVSNTHIRVLVWQIRSQLYQGHTIVNVQGEGYRLLHDGNVEPEKPHVNGA